MYNAEMINRTLRCFLAIAALLALTALSVGCGGSSSESNGSTGATAENVSAEGISAFLKPGSSTNKLVRFGKEASAAEREAASTVLAENSEAREAGDFDKQCATLAFAGADNIAATETGAAAMKLCPRNLAELSRPLNKTKSVRINTFDGEIDSLRVKGKQAQALYHGKDNKDWAVPMVKERGGWKVAAILATELNPPESKKQKEAGEPPSGPLPSTPAN
jgi:hypothetical protein